MLANKPPTEDSQPKRQRLVVIVGAGATSSCFPFLTSEALTGDVCSVGTVIRNSVRYRSNPQDAHPWKTSTEYWPVAQLLTEALRSIYRNPTFETYFHALEVLEPIAASRRMTDPIGLMDEYRPVATAFMDVLTKFEPLFRTDVLQVERLRVIERIFEIFSEFLNRPDFKEKSLPLASFFRRLAEVFELTILTLNYDDILDSTLEDYNDGFPKISAGPWRFDPKSLLERRPSENVLLHLHGSIRYGYEIRQGGQSPLIVRYPGRAQALESVRSAIRSKEALRGQGSSGGALRTIVPIISGFQKADKVMLAPSPFGFYFHTAIEELLKCQRLLVLGYGGRDEHLNTWIAEASQLNGPRYRGVFVTKVPERLRIPIINSERVPLTNLLRAMDSRGDDWIKPNDVVECSPRLRVVLSGLPLPDAYFSDLLNFLQS